MLNPYDFYITPEEYELAAKLGITRKTLSTRIRQAGWSKERAMTTPPIKVNKHEEWRNVALSNGICPNTFYTRIKSGWDVEVAATRPLQVNSVQLASDARRKFPKELLRLAESNGISRHTFYSRIRASGWDAERAATEPVWSKSEIGAYGKKCFLDTYSFLQPNPDYHESKEDEHAFYEHPESSDGSH